MLILVASFKIRSRQRKGYNSFILIIKLSWYQNWFVRHVEAVMNFDKHVIQKIRFFRLETRESDPDKRV